MMVSSFLSSTSFRRLLWVSVPSLLAATLTPILVCRCMGSLIDSKKREAAFFLATSFISTVFLLHWHKVAGRTNLFISSCLTVLVWAASSRKEGFTPESKPALTQQLERERNELTAKTLERFKLFYKVYYPIIENYDSLMPSYINFHSIADDEKAEIYFAIEGDKFVIQSQVIRRNKIAILKRLLIFSKAQEIYEKLYEPIKMFLKESPILRPYLPKGEIFIGVKNSHLVIQEQIENELCGRVFIDKDGELVPDYSEPLLLSHHVDCVTNS